jgi:Ca2+-binding RTX toxin-like protein
MATINGTNGDDLDLKGTKSADIIDGLLGADIMTGLGGNDVYIVENAGDTVKEIAGGGIDTVKSSVSFTLDAEIENLTLTGSASFGGGNTLNNIIIGNDAANVINGGAGKDTMSGGMGSDIYFVDDVGDKVVENSDPVAGGVDLIISTVTYSIAALSYVEKLSLGGTDNINATGNIHNNTLAGNDANNVLSGGGGSDVMQGQGGDDTLNGGTGSDQMEGGAGNDTFYIDTLLDLAIEVAGEGTDTVISTFAFANSVANVENYVFNTKTDVHFTGDAGDNDINGGAGNDVIVGNGGQDYLQGNAGNDTLTGGSGNDWFAGGTGADTMTGGKGNDAYYVDNIGDKVIETGDAGSGYDKIYSTISIDHLTDNIENGVLLGKAALHLTGNDLGNGLGGNWGANIIDGGKGADYLYGGLGNDTYIVDNAGDIVEEKTSGKQGGVDLVKSSVDFTLGAHVENLTLTDNGNNHGTGNDLNNVITGNDGDNVLDGGSGNDTLIGGKGGDTYFVESIGDKVVESITNAKGGGEDWVFSTIDYSLASLANVDVLYLQGTAIKATGNALDNGL